MWLLSKKEVYDQNQRKIIIIDKSSFWKKTYKHGIISDWPHDKQINFIKENILKVCNRNKLAKHFPVLKFVLSEKGGFNKMSNFYQLKKGIPTITIAIDLWSDNLSEIIVHELVHAWHEKISGYCTLKNKINQRLKYALWKKIRPKKNFYHFVDWRTYLQDFFYGIITEGLASYIVYEESNKMIFSEKQFKQFEGKAWAESKGFLLFYEKKLLVSKNLDEVKKNWNFFIDLKNSAKYSIGLHVIYTLVFSGNFSLEKIAKMEFYSILKKYESIITVRKFGKPVVSATSGRGVLDYKRMINQGLVFYNNQVK